MEALPIDAAPSGEPTREDAPRRAPRARKPALDSVLAAAVDVARAVAEELAEGEPVGEHLGATVEGDRLVSHEFACLTPGYVGWRWSVVLARAPRQRQPTVVESALLPGPEALLPPAWVPWSERLQPGDLGVGDILPTTADDPRLAPGWSDSSLRPEDEDVAARWELGLGRARVLSLEGRAEAAERWYAGDGGPDAPIAQAAPAHCASCGFFVPLAGSMRLVFGACSNVYSPSDGRIVSVDHGCGAHSEAAVLPAPPAPPEPVLDETGVEVVSVRPPEPVVVPEHGEGSVDDATPAEELGHS
ncbi:DUF3027 domain-containing protein [Motilibacter deserti]|uniref:DUF3027 domain-containing protein n=1 Tax=Motilibacter deserti TaxID=2714956 RepID=UPI002F2B46C4